MKNIVKVLAMVSLLGVLAVACQKETDNGPLPAVVTRTVDFRIDNGALQRSVLHGDVQWHNFLAAVFDSVDRGYRVSLLHEGSAAAKETVTRTTADREEAIRLADSLYNANYDVTLWYDNDAGHYVITGQKSIVPPQPDPWPDSLARFFDSIYPFWPFNEYLPGAWRRLDGWHAALVNYVNWSHHYVELYNWGDYIPYNKAVGSVHITLNQLPDYVGWGSWDSTYQPLYCMFTVDEMSLSYPQMQPVNYYTAENDSLRIQIEINMANNNYYPYFYIIQHSWDTMAIFSEGNGSMDWCDIYVRDTVDWDTIRPYHYPVDPTTLK